MTISKKIKDLRYKSGLTQDEFAQQLGLSKGAISAVEKGKNGISDKVKAKILEIYELDESFFTDEIQVNQEKIVDTSLMSRMFSEFQEEIKFLRSQLQQKDSVINSLLGKSKSIQFVRPYASSERAA